jgi:microsomal dipeptidase-like Zn-dependent dipeptidase
VGTAFHFFIPRVTSHILDKGQVQVRYYGPYANARRGKAKKTGADDTEDWPLYIKEVNGPRRMEVVWEGLKKLRYSEANVEKVLGGNLYRLYKEVIG